MNVLLFLAAIALPPKPDQYVTDRAGVVKNANALNEKLANFERQTSDQILVYVDQRLPPETTIEEMGSEAMRQWKVGQKGKDNGVILFVFIADRKMRIEVGYGLEGSLTDAKAKWITSTVIRPEFQRGDYDSGINNGVDAILAAVKNEPYVGTGRIVAELATPVGRILFVVLFSILFLVAIAAQGYIGFQIGMRFGAPLPSPATLPYAPTLTSATFVRRMAVAVIPTVCFIAVLIVEEHFFGTFPLGIVFFLLPFATFVGAFVALSMIEARFRPSGAASGSSPSFPSSSDASSSWSSSSSSSSSSFEGGGGSGGGGGASDSW